MIASRDHYHIAILDREEAPSSKRSSLAARVDATLCRILVG
jgi:hypothetical protein